MADHPVLILGVGLATPWGPKVRHALAGWLMGTVATAPNPMWETDGWPQRDAGVVFGWDPRKDLPDRKALKLMSREAQLGLLAALEACGGLDPCVRLGVPAGRFGVFAASGYEVSALDDVIGLMAASRGSDGRVDLHRAFTAGREAYNPLAPIKTLPNMALFHVACALGAQGPHVALGSSPASGLAALSEGKDALLRGDCDLALVVACDAQADPFRAQVMHEAGLLKPWPPSEGAAAVLLSCVGEGRPRLGPIVLGQELPPGPGPGDGVAWVGRGERARAALSGVMHPGERVLAGAAGVPDGVDSASLAALLGWLGAAEGLVAVALAASLVEHGHELAVPILVGGPAGDLAAVRVEATP